MAVTISHTHTHPRSCVHGDIIHIKLSAPARLDLQVQRFLGRMLLKFFSSPVVKLEIQEKKEKPQLSRCHILSDKTCTVC